MPSPQSLPGRMAPASRSETATRTHCPGIYFSRRRRSRLQIPRVDHATTVPSPSRNNLGLLDPLSLQFSAACRRASQFRSRDPLFSRAKYVPEKPGNSRIWDEMYKGRWASHDKPLPASLPTAMAPVVRSKSRLRACRETPGTREPDQEYPADRVTWSPV